MVSWSIAKNDKLQWLADQLKKLVDQLQTIEIWSIVKLIFWSIASSSFNGSTGIIRYEDSEYNNANITW